MRRHARKEGNRMFCVNMKKIVVRHKILFFKKNLVQRQIFRGREPGHPRGRGRDILRGLGRRRHPQDVRRKLSNSNLR